MTKKERLDQKARKLAKFQPGDKIYLRDTLQYLGIVVEIYRYMKDSDSPEYRFLVAGSGPTVQIHDNTSRYGRHTPWAFITQAERDHLVSVAQQDRAR